MKPFWRLCFKLRQNPPRRCERYRSEIAATVLFLFSSDSDVLSRPSLSEGAPLFVFSFTFTLDSLTVFVPHRFCIPRTRCLPLEERPRSLWVLPSRRGIGAGLTVQRPLQECTVLLLYPHHSTLIGSYRPHNSSKPFGTLLLLYRKHSNDFTDNQNEIYDYK